MERTIFLINIVEKTKVLQQPAHSVTTSLTRTKGAGNLIPEFFNTHCPQELALIVNKFFLDLFCVITTTRTRAYRKPSSTHYIRENVRYVSVVKEKKDNLI